jgi:hypothetical protein
VRRRLLLPLRLRDAALALAVGVAAVAKVEAAGI